ncbi:hypothetical protein SAMN05443144_10443 [Fodinibius roseus]|uniref:DoxX-like family protein n=1 Tax=Fodinibius roseus TaxID=1194090 RepID=A0A1M4X7G4_9BACT|nr:hypothetical protein [Fodinibius roseus]SHE89333.1 hypothetical protein SAMN05443144_10443 [Fodinibius roseus]
MQKVILSFVIIIHGLIHLLGFVKAFDLAPVEQLTEDISKTAGMFWLVVCILFLVTVFLYFTQNDIWWMVGAVAVVVSQLLIILSWSDAKYGTIANIIIAIPIIMAIAGQLPEN